jgi:hypothetical protein
MEKMAARGEHEVVSLLKRRARQYQIMVHYIDAQRLAASCRRGAAARGILLHPTTWPLLARRIAGRVRRAFPPRKTP